MVATTHNQRRKQHETSSLLHQASTKEQGTSGLGLEAQRAALDKFAEVEGFAVAGVFVEVASGKLDIEDRPGLRDALAMARKLKAPIIVSKLCRLSREVAFVSGLMARGIPFIVAAFGVGVDNLMLHIHAAMNENERRIIGQRTKDALAALKARGVTLGNKTNLAEAQAKGQATNAAKAAEFAARIVPLIKQLKKQGMTLDKVAPELTKRGEKTMNGREWHKSTISRLLKVA